jgi:predicted DNA-binding protein with PD1-like motif
MKEGNVMVHLHVVASWLDERGDVKVIGGHLVDAESFLIEFFIDSYPEVELKRDFDSETGLFLWK